jgi:hypothetical protein
MKQQQQPVMEYELQSAVSLVAVRCFARAVGRERCSNDSLVPAMDETPRENILVCEAATR